MNNFYGMLICFLLIITAENPNTVEKAYKNLEANGVIYTQAGKGAFVSVEKRFNEIHNR